MNPWSVGFEIKGIDLYTFIWCFLIFDITGDGFFLQFNLFMNFKDFLSYYEKTDK